MCNTLETKVIIYNVTSSDKPAFKESHQLIANLAVTFFFLSLVVIFSVRRKIFICKQSDRHFSRQSNLIGFIPIFRHIWAFKINTYTHIKGYSSLAFICLFPTSTKMNSFPHLGHIVSKCLITHLPK